MSKFNQSANLENYLTKNSLFKSSQRSKLVSPYVSHLNYFEKEDYDQRLQRSEGNIGLVNTFKKEYVNPSKNLEIPLQNLQNKNDILKATNKKQLLGSQQSIQDKISLPVGKGNLSKNGNIITNNLQSKHISAQQQSQHNIDREIRQSNNDSSSFNIKHSNKEIEQLEVFNGSNNQYDSKNMPSKSKANLIKIENRQLESRKDHNIASMSVVRQQQIKKSQSFRQNSYSKFNNPYNQNHDFQTRKGLGLKKTQSRNFDVMPLNLKRFKDEEIQIIEAPKQTIYNSKSSSPQKSQQFSITENNSYILNNIRNNTGQYLVNVKQRLLRNFKSLESLESQVDLLLDKNLELQCDNLKDCLCRMIQIQINEFKEREKYQLRKSKFYFMADLYEIKCNIDLRLQEIEDYNHLLNHQYKWKSVIGNIVTPNYEESIKFIEQKTDQIQKESDTKTNHYLTIYKQKIHANIALNLQKQIKKILRDSFERFISMQNEKKINLVDSMQYKTMNMQDQRIQSH